MIRSTAELVQCFARVQRTPKPVTWHTAPGTLISTCICTVKHQYLGLAFACQVVSVSVTCTGTPLSSH